MEFQHWEPGLLYVDWSIQNQLIGTLYSGNIGTYEKRIFTIQKPGDYRLEIGDGKDAGTGGLRVDLPSGASSGKIPHFPGRGNRTPNER